MACRAWRRLRRFARALSDATRLPANARGAAAPLVTAKPAKAITERGRGVALRFLRARTVPRTAAIPAGPVRQSMGELALEANALRLLRRCGELFLRIPKDAPARISVLRCAQCGILSGPRKPMLDRQSNAPRQPNFKLTHYPPALETHAATLAACAAMPQAYPREPCAVCPTQPPAGDRST